MATNLRLSDDAHEAVRREAVRSGRSQQDVIRDAIAQHLGVGTRAQARTDLAVLVASGAVRAARTKAIAHGRRLVLPPGMTTADLLDRNDRL